MAFFYRYPPLIGNDLRCPVTTAVPRRSIRRPSRIERGGFVRNSPGSVLYRSRGDGQVLVTAQVSEKVPPFLEGKGVGWLTAEYSMLPGSTPTRKDHAARTAGLDRDPAA